MSFGFRQLLKKLITSQRIAGEKSDMMIDKKRKLNGAVLLTLVAFSVFYLVQVNALSTKGFVINDLQKKIALQKKENERLQMRIIEAQSLGSLQQKIDTLGMIPTHGVEYLASSAGSVAVR